MLCRNKVRFNVLGRILQMQFVRASKCSLHLRSFAWASTAAAWPLLLTTAVCRALGPALSRASWLADLVIRWTDIQRIAVVLLFRQPKPGHNVKYMYKNELKAARSPVFEYAHLHLYLPLPSQCEARSGQVGTLHGLDERHCHQSRTWCTPLHRYSLIRDLASPFEDNHARTLHEEIVQSWLRIAASEFWSRLAVA